VVIVEDIPTKIVNVDDFIKEIDQPIRQVMIEAKIIEVTSTYSKDLGIQWGAFYKNPPTTGDHNFTIGSTGRSSTSASPNYLVNLPGAAGNAGAIGFGYINRAATFALDLQLSAMEQLQKGKIISTPRIMTMNNQEAKITTGSTIYLQSTAAGANTASFTAVDATLSLTVKPRIAPGGAISMDIDITKDEPGPTDAAGNTTILKNTAKTTVLVNDSETVVIGGIFKKSDTNTNNAVPGFSKLPLLGRLLFQKDKTVEDIKEVLIFISPRILEFRSMK